MWKKWSAVNTFWMHLGPDSQRAGAHYVAVVQTCTMQKSTKTVWPGFTDIGAYLCRRSVSSLRYADAAQRGKHSIHKALGRRKWKWVWAMLMRRDPMQMMGRAPDRYVLSTVHAPSRGRISVRMLTITLEQLPKIRRITAYGVNVTYA